MGVVQVSTMIDSSLGVLSHNTGTEPITDGQKRKKRRITIVCSKDKPCVVNWLSKLLVYFAKRNLKQLYHIPLQLHISRYNMLFKLFIHSQSLHVLYVEFLLQ